MNDSQSNNAGSHLEFSSRKVSGINDRDRSDDSMTFINLWHLTRGAEERYE